MDLGRDSENSFFSEDSKAHLASVELFTLQAKVSGQLVKGLLRISDLFNQVDRPLLTMRNAKIVFFNDKNRRVEVGEAHINTQSVVMVIPQETGTPQRPEGGIDPALVRVQKQRHSVTVEAPPFTITGLIHLLGETKISDALQTLISSFIPITDASIALANAPGVIRADTVIVNRTFIQMLYATPGALGSPEGASPGSPSRTLLRRTE